MKPRATYVIISVLAILLLSAASVILWYRWQIYGIAGWRDQLYEAEGSVASRQALSDFREGHLRLYTLGGENEHPKYTGTNEGPFEIWILHFYPALGGAHRYSKEQFIEFYNRKMRYIQAHPDKFQQTRKEAPQARAANRSESVASSESDGTPVAAGLVADLNVRPNH